MNNLNIICFSDLCNNYLIIEEDKNSSNKYGIIIDAGLYNPTPLLKKIHKEKIKITAIIHTHTHIDHIYATGILAEQLRAAIFVHSAEQQLINDDKFNLSTLFGLEFLPPKEVKPLCNDSIISICETSFKILHTPGHTVGSICLLEENNKLIFSGDTVFRDGVGRVDLPGGNYQLLKNSIYEKLFSLPDDYKVYPGHGSFAQLKHIKTTVTDYLK